MAGAPETGTTGVAGAPVTGTAGVPGVRPDCLLTRDLASLSLSLFDLFKAIVLEATSALAALRLDFFLVMSLA